MKDSVWFITGASRGLGLNIAKEALLTGAKVVATARNSHGLSAKFEGNSDKLLTVDLDVTDNESIAKAVIAAKEKFGRIDVLVNNAGYGQMGRFETISEKSIRQQYDVNLFGLMQVTRKVLPVMREYNSGHIFNISSIGGSRGYAGSSIYCSSKFAVEGYSEGLASELEPFNIKVTIVEPGFFRTDFLESSSAVYGDIELDAYKEFNDSHKNEFDDLSKNQPGNPIKLAHTLFELAMADTPPIRFPVGSDALQYVGTDIALRQLELATWSKLTSSTDFNE